MLVSGYSEMKPFLPAINMKGAPTVFNDALDVAQQTLVEYIIGADLEAQLERRDTEDAKLLKLCQRVIAVDAFLHSIPEMDLVLTDAGFGVISNQDVAPASKERIANLTAGLQAKLDEALDRLVVYLIRTSAYSDWKGTEQFTRLSDGLILTYADFKDVAVLNAITVKNYPQTWGEFLKLNGSFNLALVTDIAAYISPDYADEILEKIRDGEQMCPNEKKLVQMVKVGICFIALGDRDNGVAQAVRCAAFMKANISDFPTFADSSAARAITLEHEDKPIFSMF